MRTTMLAAVGLLAALALHGIARPVAAQEATGAAPRAAVRLSADTVRVGEPFTVGIVVSTADPVRFPPLLETDDRWEQLDVVRLQDGDGGGVRAFYRLVAWEAGPLELPAVAFSIGTRPGREFSIAVGGPFVASALPADAEGLRLKGPRTPFGRPFPWILVAILALLAALALHRWLRRRQDAGLVEVEGTSPTLDAAQRAREALAALRRRAEAGELGDAPFYDQLESILRDYLAATREWPATLPVRVSPYMKRGSIRELHRHAVASRFGGVGARGDRLTADVDTSVEWIDGDAA